VALGHAGLACACAQTGYVEMKKKIELLTQNLSVYNFELYTSVGVQNSSKIKCQGIGPACPIWILQAGHGRSMLYTTADLIFIQAKVKKSRKSLAQTRLGSGGLLDTRPNYHP
jgi:hypothetical protein